ncbi:Lymphoid-specific helicase [Frankliniella fusca]|uniref:Proliferation-associated SNF2-like protein n=1 Tax=Frankliniella fusca TaxID=407009 RepID=A0AAE1GY48_9NEOP|nr:Lymphoid-specific helicase [Frankliniella fusca]
MSKDDPTFNYQEELRAQRGISSQTLKSEMTPEEHRESIIQRTMHALSVSEKLTELIVKRMHQSDSMRKSMVDAESSAVDQPGKKRKAGKSPGEKSQKFRKENDGSAQVMDSTYVNEKNLRVSNRQPKLLEGAVMRDYQLDGLDWLVTLDLNGANGILADEMGLGKTIQVISLISFLVEVGVGSEAPFLVIGPLSTLHNWVAEFKNFSPKIPVILFHGSKEERMSLRRKILKKCPVNDEIETFPVVVTSFEIPLRDAYLRTINWRYLVIDEGHRLKNHKCLLVKELRRYRSTNRLLLTGTPLQNNMTELWSLLNFILPNIVTDMDVFECWFDPSFLDASDASEKIVQAEEKNKVLSTLHKILKPFLLRRVKADVGLNIPPKKEITIYAPMTKWQTRLYSAVADKTLRSLQGKRKDLDDPEALARAIRRSSKICEEISSPQADTDTSHTSPALRSSSRLRKSKSSEGDCAPSYSQSSETLPMPRRTRGKGIVQSGDYKLLANGVPLNAIREEPVYFEDDSFDEDIATDKLLEGLAEPNEEFVTEMKISHPVSMLRQICNHPYLASFPVIPGTRMLKVDEQVVQRSGKMQILDAILQRLQRNGHKVLIFSNFTKMLDIIEDYLLMRKYQYTRLDGTRDLTNRQINIKKFNSDEEVFVFLISTRAGGLGINLVAADTVIIYDSDWNPQADLQAQDRCHRIGQTKPVVVYRFVVKGTIDQHIINRAETKKQLDKLVIQHGKFKNWKKNEMVSLQELRELLESKDRNEIDIDNGLGYTSEELDVLCDRGAVFTSDKKEEASPCEVGSEEIAETIAALSDLETESEGSDSQDAFSLRSEPVSDSSSFHSQTSGSNVGSFDCESHDSAYSSSSDLSRNLSLEREQ